MWGVAFWGPGFFGIPYWPPGDQIKDIGHVAVTIEARETLEAFLERHDEITAEAVEKERARQQANEFGLHIKASQKRTSSSSSAISTTKAITRISPKGKASTDEGEV